MKTPDPTYRRPIYASLYFGLALLVVVLTAYILIASFTQLQIFFTNPVGYVLAIIFLALVGTVTATLLWGVGQLFDLVGRIEYNTRQNSTDATVDYLRQIAKNTRPSGDHARDENDTAFYYYREDDGTTRGPLKRGDLRTLLNSERISPYTQVTPELAGTRLDPVAVVDLLRQS